MPSQRLLEILSRADAELRAHIEELLREGSYGDIALVARFADAISQLKTAATSEEPLAHLNAGQPTSPHTGALDAAPRVRKHRVKDYPKFGRDGDKLVKTAWSKRERAEYEHRAPRRAVELVIQAIVKKKGEGKKFEATDVLPVKDPETRQDIPSYQSYMALAWLRAEGVITKKGRNGYVLKAGAATPERVSELWEGLPIH